MSETQIGDVKLAAAQIPALARGLAEAAIGTLDATWEILDHCGVGWRETMVNSVSAEIQKRLVALATAKPTVAELGAAIFAAADAISGRKVCSKCGVGLPDNAYCKSFDCPMNPNDAPARAADLPVRFVSVTPPRGGVGATHKL